MKQNELTSGDTRCFSRQEGVLQGANTAPPEEQPWLLDLGQKGQFWERTDPVAISRSTQVGWGSLLSGHAGGCAVRADIGLQCASSGGAHSPEHMISSMKAGLISLGKQQEP